MLANNAKRWFSFLLALVMVFSLVPVQALAAEDDTHDHDHGDEIVVESTSEPVTEPVTEPATEPVTEPATEPVTEPATEPETEPATEAVSETLGEADAEAVVEIGEMTLLRQIQEQMDAILVKYLGTTLPKDDIQTAVQNMDWDTIQSARSEIHELEKAAMELPEADLQILVDRNAVCCDFATALEENAGISTMAAKTVTVLDGQVSITDTEGTGKVSNGVVTITAKGSLLSKKTNTVTVRNETESLAELKFDYSASTYNSFTIAGASVSASGTYSALLEPGASVTLVIKSNSGFSNLTATLTMSSFSLTAAAASSNVTIDFDSNLGSVTAGGTAVTSGTTQEVSLADGVELVAAPNSGVRFLGWINEADGAILSTATTYALKPTADISVKAVFVGAGSAPWFSLGAASSKSVSSGLLGMSKISYSEVGSSYLFDDLNAAAAAAAAGNNKYLVLMNDATLPAGEYTIPAGVTLLIPFDNVNSLYTTQAVNTGTYVKPTAYRTLTMADGAKLTINGAMSISAKQNYADGASPTTGGAPTGPVGFVRMEGSSNITVNNGGALYAYGFITGSGSVTANSGASVYEMFQFSDFRGGTQSTDMDNGVFPLSQYYVQNIEVPLTLYSGAKEYAYTTIYMSSSDFGSAVAFIAGSGAMFNLTSGYVTKRYDGTTDRLMVEAHGDLTLSGISMSVGMSSINSKNYELPINSNITVNVVSGNITINQDIAMLPGAQIIVGEGAVCTLGNNINVYIYDADQWGNFASPYNRKFIPVAYAPGKSYTRTEADLVDASIVVNGTVDASKGYVYTTAGGANIYSTGSGVAKIRPGTQTVTYQLVQNTGYTNIPITSAKLKNADGSYMETTITSGTYTYENGVWVKACNHEYTETVISEADCENDGLKRFTCKDTVICGHSYEEVILATGHDMTEATCTEPATCKNGCGHTEGEALGHTPGDAATCTTAQTCTVCGEELAEALGHTEAIDAAVEPSCTETGLTEGKHCSVCGEVLIAQEVVDALGHTEAIDAAVEPSCTETGLTEGKHCSVCGEVLIAQEVVDALDHDWDEGEVTTEPSCEQTGVKTYTCSRCGETKDESVDALGHDIIHDAQQDATCTEPGVSAGGHCSRCDYTEGMGVIPALGHDWNDGEITTDPTCTETGVKTYTCSRCGETKTETVGALGHTEAIDEAVAATCTETGLTEGTHCSVCGEVLVAQEVVDALGHTEAIDEAVAATCTETGLTEGKHCSVCGEVLVAQEVVDALGHTEAIDEAVAPSCAATGLTEGKHCSVCGEVLVAQETVEKLPHTEVIDEEEPAFCDQDGKTEGKHCSVCGEVLIAQDVIPALGHNIIQVEAKQPTYTNVGWEAYEECTRCAYSTYVEIPALEAPTISDYETFLVNLALLEEMAHAYVLENPGKDPAALVIKYIRTGVDRYNSGSWGIMAGYEDAGFAAFVRDMEDAVNSTAESVDQMIAVSSLKNIENFYLPNGDYVDFGHMFGTMDITYHNKTSVNHADVAGWAGDLVDLLSLADQFGVGEAATVNEMVEHIANNYLLKHEEELVDTFGEALREGTFSLEDMRGDLDGYYVMQMLYAQGYENGTLTAIATEYFTEDLSDEVRAAYLLNNRLNGANTRNAIRDAVYNAYTGNKVIATLESTREFTNTDVSDLRKAACYAFADYLCKLAGDYVEVTDNPYYTVFSSEFSNLAPGITQEIKFAYSADNKQMVYYIATADLSRDDVNVYANYNNNDPAAGWAMARVEDQAAAAQEKYGNPESEYYIPNYNVITSINGDGFNMSTGEPSGLLVMNGVEYHPVNSSGFFAILKDGTAIIGTQKEYQTYKDQIQEAIGGFGTTLVKDGKIVITASSNYYTSRASRTAVGITRTGKVVFMVLDGRQEPWSCGGSMEEIAQIMLEAGCVHAINLDGGGSTTFVAKQEGADRATVVNRPSDGFARSVSTSLMMVSTAPNSTAFDHAIVEAETEYLTVGSSVQVSARGVSVTGNTAELPEGTTWAVSDDRWGSITEDGVFTGLRNGSVDVYLMLGEEIIGSLTMNIVVPDNVYFTKDNMNAVYGQSVVLPVKALYEGKEVAIQATDLVFALSNESAGTVEGFSFTATENSGLKSVKVTAALAQNTEVTASITVSLYNQGEVSFDFEQATGGDRQMAWDRQVTNSTTEDSITYEIVNIDEDMVTSYTFAIDMTQIPIPQQLSDLIYMLPGADAEGASAWNFLLQLAERVSVLTEVKPVMRFDANFDVDYSELKLVNEYFELTNTEFDEAANTLTLTLNWKDQTQAIDPETANPLCIVSGIKLTPRDDAEWDSKDQLTAVNGGQISYKVYLRANALYSFALKEENQRIYGIYPFDNTDVIIGGASEKGGYFGDVYAEFSDTYTLVKSVKNGWIVEDGGYAYYVDGEKYTGVQPVDGLYYDFGENGINTGKTPYTGLFKQDGKLYYAQFGKLNSGWIAVGEDYYYFSTANNEARTGVSAVAGKTYTFDDEGRLVRGAFEQSANGTRYYWAGQMVYRNWIHLEEGIYWADGEGYIAHGNFPVKEDATGNPVWWHFDEETGLRTGICDGFFEYQGAEYYCENGVYFTGAVGLDDAIIYCGTNGKVTKSQGIYVNGTSLTNCELEKGYYYCTAEGVIQKDGFATVSGYTFYFTDYQRAKGFTKVGEDYYFFNAGSGMMYTDMSLWVDANAYGIEPGVYYFQADGTMLIPDLENGVKEIVNIGGKLYFTVDGVTMKSGLYELDGEYYHAAANGVLAVSTTVWVSQHNGLLPNGEGYYAFDGEGKLIKTGFVTGGGLTYYYKDMVRQKGFTKIGEDYYFLNAGSGMMYTDISLWVDANAYGIEPGVYYFQEDGTMLIPDLENGVKGIVNIGGKLYFTVDGVTMKSGLYELDGEYYHAAANGVLAVSTTVWVSQHNGLLPNGEGYYAFDGEGKLIKTGFVTGGGITYYYKDMVRQKGFTKIGEDYYFLNAGSGMMYTDISLWVDANAYGIEPGVYYFQADGTMLIPDLENGVKEIVNIGGKLYFTVDGVTMKSGLYELDGEYYHAAANGVLAVSTTVWVSQHNGLLPNGEGYYAFDGEGKLIKTGFVTGGGITYYYKDMVRQKGFTKIGEDYYFLNAGSGMMYTDISLWVDANAYGIEPGVYYFQADGTMLIPDLENGVKEIVNIGGKLYFTVDGVTMKSGLYELDGEYYHAAANGVLAVSTTVWVSQHNGLLPNGEGYYAFDGEGKLIKTGFVTGGGLTYYYKDMVRQKGFTKIGEDYYFLNAGSGMMYTNITLWVDSNSYGIPAGTYYFGADGKMVIS